MQYTTTKCNKCGYRIRNHQSNVPNVQLGISIIRCPNCGQLGIDGIVTEYEFMTEIERKRFTTEAAKSRSYFSNILYILLGLVFLVGGISIGDGTIFLGLLFGGGLFVLGISNLVRNGRLANEKVIEQAVYESLQRTKNSKYVKTLQSIYAELKIKRNYIPDKKRDAFLEQNKIFEERETYVEAMKQFEELMKEISENEELENNKEISKNEELENNKEIDNFNNRIIFKP